MQTNVVSAATGPGVGLPHGNSPNFTPASGDVGAPPPPPSGNVKASRASYQGLHRHARARTWCFAYRGEDGRWRHHSTGKAGKQEAKEERRKFLAEVAEGRSPTALARWTVAQLAARWLGKRKVRVARRTWRTDGDALKPVIAALGHLRAEQVTLAIIEDYQTRRLGAVAPGRSRPPGAYTVNREVQRLSCLLRDAGIWRRLKDDYRQKRLREQPSDMGREIPGEVLRPMLDAALANPAWRNLGYAMILALNTGMRGEEVKGLQLGRLELNERPAVVIAIKPLTAQGAGDEGRRGTKTPAGQRRVPLNKHAEWAARQLLASAQALGARRPWHYLFPANLSRHTKRADPLCGKRGWDVERPQQSFRSAWGSLRREAERHTEARCDYRFHDLRHTFITWCGRAGVPLEKVMAMVGHLSKKMTLFYMHLNDADTRTVVDMVAGQTPQTSQQMAEELGQLRLRLADLAGRPTPKLLLQ